MFFYVHGFNSIGGCRSAQELAKVLQSNIISPTYDSSWHFEKTLNYLCKKAKETLPRDEPLFILGTSLGGFYALHMANKLHCSCVSFNPVTSPATQMLPLVGFTSNYYTEKEWEFTLDTLNSYQDAPDPRLSDSSKLIILGNSDELLDHSITKDYWHAHAQIIETDETHQIADYGVYQDIITDFFVTVINLG